MISKEQSNTIKIIAIVLMVIDHIGYVFYPEILWLRIIGRGAFFLFAYQIAIGFENSSNTSKYLLRLGLFALISQFPYQYLFQTDSLNIFFTLFLGAATLWGFKKFGLFALPIALMLGEIIRVDYGAYGVGVIVLSYFFSEKIWYLVLSQLGLYLLNIVYLRQYDQLGTIALFEFTGLLAYLSILLPINLKISINKYFFYAFYPLHILIFILIRSALD